MMGRRLGPCRIAGRCVYTGEHVCGIVVATSMQVRCNYDEIAMQLRCNFGEATTRRCNSDAIARHAQRAAPGQTPVPRMWIVLRGPHTRPARTRAHAHITCLLLSRHNVDVALSWLLPHCFGCGTVYARTSAPHVIGNGFRTGAGTSLSTRAVGGRCVTGTAGRAVPWLRRRSNSSRTRSSPNNIALRERGEGWRVPLPNRMAEPREQQRDRNRELGRWAGHGDSPKTDRLVPIRPALQ